MSARKDNRNCKFVVEYTYTDGESVTRQYRSKVYPYEEAWAYTLTVIRHAYRAGMKLDLIQVRRFNKRAGHTVWSNRSLSKAQRRDVFQAAMSC